MFCLAATGIFKKDDEEQKVVTIINIFHQTPAASSKFIKQLCLLVIRSEQAMLIEASSPFREVLMKFLLRYPAESMDIFLQDVFIKVLYLICLIRFFVKYFF